MATSPNGCFLSYILKSPREYPDWNAFRRDVEAVARAGYHGIEIQMAAPDDFGRQDLSVLLADCGLRLAAIQTGAAYLSSGICLASPDPAIRASAEDLLRRYIEWAGGFGAIVVFGLLQGTTKEEPDRSPALARIRSSLRKLVELARNVGSTIAIEPVNRYECAVFHNTVEEVVESVNLIGSPALRAMVDTFHVNIEEPSQRGAIAAARGSLSHMHVSETNRGMFGTGHLDFAEVFDALRESGYSGFASIGIYREQPSVADRSAHAIKHLHANCSAAHA